MQSTKVSKYVELEVVISLLHSLFCFIAIAHHCATFVFCLLPLRCPCAFHPCAVPAHIHHSIQIYFSSNLQYCIASVQLTLQQSINSRCIYQCVHINMYTMMFFQMCIRIKPMMYKQMYIQFKSMKYEYRCIFRSTIDKHL